MPIDHDDYDLIVVGAGPAGSASALAALRARPTARVLLLDRAPVGRDKVCGDGIAPHVLPELEALGVTGVVPAETVSGIRFSIQAGPSAALAMNSPLHVVPRATFDARLVRSAIEAGARFVLQKVTTVERTPAGVSVNGRFRAPVVIAADGSNSVVRRQIGLAPNRGSALAVAVRGYAPTPAGLPDEMVIRWDNERRGGLCYAWAFPTGHGTTNVGYGMSSASLDNGRAQLVERMRVLLPEYPLDGLEMTGHTLPLSIRRPPEFVGSILLVGDAASLINPLTGEGIYAAVASGAMAGSAAVERPDRAGPLYRERLARRFAVQHRQLRWLYPLLDSQLVLSAVLRTCQHDQRMFARLVEVALGDSTFRLGEIARLGWNAGVPTQPDGGG